MKGSTLSRGASLLLLLGLWQAASSLWPSASLPPPSAVAAVVLEQAASGDLFRHTAITLARVAASFVLAMGLGVSLGLCMGARPGVDRWLDGPLIVALNVPALVIIILCYVWLGLGELAAVVAVALNKFPMVVVATREGARAIDKQLMAVAKVYRVSPWRTWTRVYLPQLLPHLTGAARNGLALVWKIVLVVELLGRSNGVGFALANYFHFFDVAGILAYTFCFTALMLGLEALLLRPLEARLNRWRT